MSSGRLGAVDLAAATNTTVYTVPTGNIATVSVNFCNRNTDTVSIRLALLDGAIGTLSAEDYLEYDNELCHTGGVLERTGIVMAAGQTIVAYSDTSNVSVQVWGWEEEI